MTTETQLSTPYSKWQIRIALSAFFFCQGICFASWASRIPDIKTALHLNEAELGTILLFLPIAQLLTMPFSGRAITRFGSKNILIIAILCYCFTLTNIGLVTKPWHLALCLFCFGVSGNMCNISVNTQAVNADSLYDKPMLASFHGVWSSAGFVGAFTGLMMIKWHKTTHFHFIAVACIVLLLVLLFNKYLLHTPTSKAGASFKRIKKPQGLLLQLGLIGFLCLSCEGCMFDWSGVYFKQIVKAEGPFISLGYASFMIMMATGRFMGDKLAQKYSRKKMVQTSGVMIFSGMMLAVLLPYIITATIGFLIVGLGVSTIIPLLYSTLGKANLNVSKSIAIATVSSISFLGFLMGPPLIGYIAQIAGLQYSFSTIAFFGLSISFLIQRVKEIA